MADCSDQGCGTIGVVGKDGQVYSLPVVNDECLTEVTVYAAGVAVAAAAQKDVFNLRAAVANSVAHIVPPICRNGEVWALTGMAIYPLRPVEVPLEAFFYIQTVRLFYNANNEPLIESALSPCYVGCFWCLPVGLNTSGFGNGQSALSAGGPIDEMTCNFPYSFAVGNEDDVRVELENAVAWTPRVDLNIATTIFAKRAGDPNCQPSRAIIPQAARTPTCEDVAGQPGFNVESIV